MKAYLLAGLAHRQLGDQRAADQAAEHALAPAEQNRVILPFAMTGAQPGRAAGTALPADQLR
jgi:LuxR family transcriptional regulator, maltose regulon positive regulatory protein